MRVALGIEYSGENYCGWQRQKHSPSVQENLEKVLTQIADQPIKVFCAGRTDTGVHATGQVVHFDMNGSRPESAWMRGANNYLANDISIVWSMDVQDDFHARFSAVSRTYRYIIQNTVAPAASLYGKVTWHRKQLDAKLIQKGANYLIGQHDFSSFQASSCQANTSTRTVEFVRVQRVNELIIIDIKANAFLHHMVRNLVGCLLQIGEARQSPEFVSELLQVRDRRKAPDTAKPHGLYLVGVGYPETYSIPQNNFFPLGYSF